MSGQNDTFLRVKPKSVKIPYENNEEQRFEDFLKARGLKKGPFLRVLINREIDGIEAIEAGKTQININAFRGATQGQEEVQA